MTILPKQTSLTLPIQPYQVSGYSFKERLRRHLVLWTTHLGDDILAPAGTAVYAIGGGTIELSQMHPGSAAKPNWGGLVIIAHTNKHTKDTFYSIYGHLDQLKFKQGNTVAAGQQLGLVAAGNSPANGWWQKAHLHFGICTTRWRGLVPPGWRRPEQWRRTKTSHWHNPEQFIKQYNLADS